MYPIFNVCDPSPFYAQPDSKMNPFQEGGNDIIMDASFNEESLAKFKNGSKKLKKHKDNLWIGRLLWLNVFAW